VSSGPTRDHTHHVCWASVLAGCSCSESAPHVVVPCTRTHTHTHRTQWTQINWITRPHTHTHTTGYRSTGVLVSSSASGALHGLARWCKPQFPRPSMRNKSAGGMVLTRGHAHAVWADGSGHPTHGGCQGEAETDASKGEVLCIHITYIYILHTYFIYACFSNKPYT
jgi:hypothetical protein